MKSLSGYEIGDGFIIVDSEHWIYECKDQKEFVIKSFSKSGMSVYYEDNRTNPKCRCNNCSMIKGVKCIGVFNIELVSKRIQRERENKLKRLGI